MTNKFIVASLLGVFLLVSFSSFAQIQIGFGGIYTKRMGEFNNSTYKDGYGAMFSIYSGSLLPKSYPFKLRLGLGFNGSNAGVEKFEVETIEPANNVAKIRFKNNNNAMYWAVRMEKKVERIAFYGDILYGTRNLHSLKKVQLLDDPEKNYEDDADRLTESKRVFLGLGAGISYYLTNNSMLDFNIHYTKSKSFTYLDLTTIEQDLNQIYYEYKTAKSSDVLTFNLGIKFNLVGIKNLGDSSNSGSTSGNSSNNTKSNNSGSSSSKKGPVQKEPSTKKKIKVKTNSGGGGNKDS